METTLERIRQTLELEINNGQEASIINVVNYLIELAHNIKASDIHIDPQAEVVRIRLRVDGVLQDDKSLPKSIHSEVISRIKILAGLRTDEHQTAQDGRFKIQSQSGPIDIRVSIVPTYYGENAVLRLLKDQNQEFSLDVLGFSKNDQEKILRAIKYPYGMILATGPTGSGKTTTLYTLLKLLNNPKTSIITIEDPIEYSLEGVNQIGVNAKTGLSFANGLRSMLRQDPNIIMVGEIRDQETAGLAVNTALTGHLMLSSIHTNDAVGALPRLIDLGIEPYLIASTVNIIIAQRLVRRMCQNCKSKEGCLACNMTGYSGRVCINEVLEVNNTIREIIHRKGTAEEIKAEAKKQGMATMAEDGFAKVEVGITTTEEVLRTLHE